MLIFLVLQTIHYEFCAQKKGQFRKKIHQASVVPKFSGKNCKMPC